MKLQPVWKLCHTGWWQLMSTSSVEIQHFHLIWMWGPTDFWWFHFQWSDSPTGMNVLASHFGFTFMAVVSLQTCSVLNGLGKLIHPCSCDEFEYIGKNSIADDVCTWKSHSSKLKRSSLCSTALFAGDTVPLSPIYQPKSQNHSLPEWKNMSKWRAAVQANKKLTSNRCRNRSKTNCFPTFLPHAALASPPGRDFNLLFSSVAPWIVPEERSGSSTVGWVGGMELIAGNIAEVGAALNLVWPKRNKQQCCLKGQKWAFGCWWVGVVSALRGVQGHFGRYWEQDFWRVR